MKSIEQSCYWLASPTRSEETAPLQGDQQCQIAIVGGGFTGLWCAYFLKQLNPVVDVALVEQGVCGYGASGRNAGIMSCSVDHSHALAIAHFGLDDAARLSKIGRQNIFELAEFAADCDVHLTGQLSFAFTPGHLEDCKHVVQAAEQLGLEGYQVLSREEAQEQLHSPLYQGAMQSPDGGIINPHKLVDKLKAHAIAGGVKVYERSKVTSVTAGCVSTASGKLTADKVIMATDAYTHHFFPQLLWRFIPLYDYILVSEPLTAEQLAQLGWKNRQAATDCRSFFNYYRLTEDNRILWGTSEAVYYAPNKVDESCDHSQEQYTKLKASFVRHFPYLADVEFPYAWGGPIASTTRLTPFFGELHNGRTLYALGYTGHGIGTTRLAGKILAHMALAVPTDLMQLKMVQEKPFPYPPEPLRRMAVGAVTKSLRDVDAGQAPNALLKVLDVLGIGFSS